MFDFFKRRPCCALCRQPGGLLLIFALLGFPETGIPAPEGWTLRHQNLGGGALQGIASGPSGLVAVGDNGLIMTSADGQAWTVCTSGVTDRLTAVTYGKGFYVAVGDHGRILTSPDGATWTNVAQTATTARLNNVGCGGSFLAVGDAGTVLYSTDALHWTANNPGTTLRLRGLTFGTGQPHAVITGEAGTCLLASLSYDGSAKWSQSDAGGTDDLEAVIWTHDAGSIRGPGYESVLAVGARGAARGLGLITMYPQMMTDTVPSVPLPTTARLRTIVGGKRYQTCDYYSPTTLIVSGFSDDVTPLIAADETGHVFAASNANGAWTEQSPGLGVGINAGVYVLAEESFFLVGQNESVFQLGSVYTGRLSGISARGLVGRGDDILIAGIVVRGSAPKPILIRGLGPALGAYGVANPLPNPVLTVFDSKGKAMATNSGWYLPGQDPAQLSAAAVRVGAINLAPGSADAAMVLTLSPGTYTIQVASANNATGVGLVEAYDLDDAVSGTSRATSIASRGQVGTGENVLIAGLIVRGPASRQVLLRGVGPGLTRYGVAHALADPVITLFSSTRGVIASNDNWNINQSLPAVMTACGAFPLDEGSKDAAFVITLDPGTYTVIVSGANGTTGVALVEAYEVPADQ